MICRALLTACLVIGVIPRNGAQTSIKMTVYYESSCRGSADFIVNQLLKTWTEFKDYILLYMVPLAVIQQNYYNGHMSFTCGGGPKECEVNALHVCAYHVACRGMEQIYCPEQQMTLALDYTKCLVQSKNQKEASKGCARKVRLPSTELNECAAGWVGETLQSHYGNLTIEEVPLIKMDLPHIVIDTYINYYQDYARTNLRSLVCGLMPDKCWDWDISESYI